MKPRLPGTPAQRRELLRHLAAALAIVIATNAYALCAELILGA